MIKNNSFLYSLILLFSINIILLFTIHLNWNSSMKLFFSIQKELSSVKSNITEAHLWFEEMFSGDTSIDINQDIIIPFSNYEFKEYIGSLESQEFKHKSFIMNSLEEINTNLEELFRLALYRLEYATSSGTGSAKDQEFDKQFEICLTLIDKMVLNVNVTLENEIQAKNIYFGYILILFIITNIIIFTMLIIITRNSKKQDKTIFEQTRMASMGEMIGNIAHQWRQPLSVISTGATGMQVQKEYGMLNDEMFYDTCESINKNAQYLSKTIDDFRNYIKGDTKKVKFNLKKEIDSFLSLVNPIVKSSELQVVIDIENNIMIYGYKNELIQSLINLFNNTKDAFLQNNEIKDKYFFIFAKQNKGSLEIKVKDSAGGMNTTVLKHLFEPYFTTKHKSQGTGLGLHMTYNLINNGMKGNIEANTIKYVYKNKNYVGAEFIITIPMQ